VVVNNFNVNYVSIIPYEAHSVLIVDADTVLTFPVAVQLFQVVRLRQFQVFKGNCGVQLNQPPTSLSLDLLGKFRRETAFENPLGFFVFEVLDCHK